MPFLLEASSKEYRLRMPSARQLGEGPSSTLQRVGRAGAPVGGSAVPRRFAAAPQPPKRACGWCAGVRGQVGSALAFPAERGCALRETQP